MGRERSTFSDLPPRMVCRQRPAGKFYYFSTRSPERKEIPLGKDLRQALAEYKRLAKDEIFCRVPIPQGFAKELLKRMLKNARARKIEVHIGLQDIEAMLVRARGRCELTGLQFDFRITDGCRIKPWIPSVDRIDAAGPYIASNCRLVCAAVNIALNQFGENLLVAIATGLLKQQARRAKKKVVQ